MSHTEDIDRNHTWLRRSVEGRAQAQVRCGGP
eukprot:CAMPEP_0195105042 /NCGR_PEP_ID=MMETSP0448-20130528/74724_1 /TAXON_ID=66468 /ORGANISM="Heterocapsa triquestra, Strain CCMP 448" /LENGTH=31 /DNA_ID= /DNA_START= /DNA_END= /DNA_ORIENTATION=